MSDYQAAAIADLGLSLCVYLNYLNWRRVSVLKVSGSFVLSSLQLQQLHLLIY